jgi:hypothetical protein
VFLCSVFRTPPVFLCSVFRTTPADGRSLRDNNIGDQGATAIGNALEVNATTAR